MNNSSHEEHSITVAFGRETYSASYVVDSIAITVTWLTNGQRRELSTYSVDDHDRTAKQLLREMVMQDIARTGWRTEATLGEREI